MSEPATLLMVHGAWCGEWVYWKLAPCFEQHGIQFVGADLPSCRATDNSVGPLDDVAYTRALIDEIDGPVVVAGKSYGGLVVSGATVDHPNVAHLVYIAALMPGAGEPFQQRGAQDYTPEFAAGMHPLDDGRMAIDIEVGARYAFSQASEQDRDVWRRNGSPMGIGSDRSVSFARVGWEELPSTYVVCTEDVAVLPSSQRALAKQATRSLDRPWDHSPGVSHPNEVAALLASIARAPEQHA